jgi:glucose-6-phosphate 1-dehydrogenase
MDQNGALPVIEPRIGKPADPCAMVIFGASGDLTRRKLIPALYNLAKNKLLSPNFAVVGVARSPMSSEDYRKKVSEDIKQFATDKVDPEIWEQFIRRVYYHSGDMGDKKLYLELKDLLEKLDKDHSTNGNHMYYMATAADFFGPGVEQLAAVGLMQQDSQYWRRVVIEKPFGHDLESARLLNQQLLRVADEKQIYRIDHYLGKETVQNILALRFANGIFEPIWNRRYIDHIQISVAETVGVEKRGGYYDKAGALRDMVPNHIMQLISLTAMEPPVSYGPTPSAMSKAKFCTRFSP